MNENTNNWAAMPQNTPSPYDATGAMSWDSAITREGSEFTLLPPGDYPFTVTKFERQHFAGSAKLPPCNMAELTLSINGGAKGSAAVTHRLFLHQRCEWALSDFFLSIGQKQRGEALRPRWNEVEGARGMCRLKVSEYHSSKYNDTREKNEVAKFLPPPEPCAAGAATAAPAPAGSPAPAAPPAPGVYTAPAAASASAQQQSWPLPKSSAWGAWGA